MLSIIYALVIAMASSAVATPSPQPAVQGVSIGSEHNGTTGGLSKRKIRPCANTGWKTACFQMYWGKDCYVNGPAGEIGNNPHYPQHQACYKAADGNYPSSIWVEGSGCTTQTWSNNDCTGSPFLITHPNCTAVSFRSVSVDC